MFQVSILINFNIERCDSNLDTLRGCETNCFDKLLLISMNILKVSNISNYSFIACIKSTLKRPLISKELVLSENKSNTEPDLLLTSKQTGSWPKNAITSILILDRSRDTRTTQTSWFA